MLVAGCNQQRTDGPRDAAGGGFDATASDDLASSADLGLESDLPPSGDLGGADQATSMDQAAPGDLARPVDLAQPGDLAQPVDLSIPVDLSMRVDLSMPVDLSTPPDLAQSNDPFDPASCNGAPLSQAGALSLLGTTSRTALATAQWMVRERACTSPGNCGAWGVPKPFLVSLVVYSGGVTTRYKTFAIPSTLVLLKKSSTVASLEVRETKDYVKYPSSSDKGIPFAIPAAPGTYYLPTIEIYDPAASGYDYSDNTFSLYYPADNAYLYAAEHCARFTAPYDNGTAEIAALYQY